MTSDDDLKVLKRARELLADGWTTGVLASDHDFQRVSVISPQATHYCLTGAIRRAAYDLNLIPPEGQGHHRTRDQIELELCACTIDAQAIVQGRLDDELYDGIHSVTLEDWNDNRATNHDVLNLLDLAIHHATPKERA